MRLSAFKVLSFDCYGTLIDWERGILAALRPLLARAGPGVTGEAALEAYARAESARTRQDPSALYPRILEEVYRDLAEAWGVEAPGAEAAAFGASVPDWPAFPDSAPALRYLKSRCRLVILSNVDRASFAGSNRRLEVEFDAIYTAEEIGSYKPDRRNFEYLIEHVRRDLGFGKEEILHNAQSLFHDHVPATALGLATNWIDRRAGRKGSGATMPPPHGVRTDFRHPDMAAFAEAHRRDRAG